MVLPQAPPSGGSDLPAIICLHGAGTNGNIFRLQARTVLQKLKGHFRFIFIDAPFEGQPGPGVLPTYAGMKPYLWWHCDESSVNRFNISGQEIRRRRREVRLLLSKHLEDPTVVGVMAFSQGARVATGLCLDKELRRNIKFAILIAATFPALTVGESQYDPCCADDSDSDSGSGSEASLPLDDVQSQIVRLNIPSVHVQGTSDPWAAEGARLRKTYFEEDKAAVIRFAGGHAVPVAKADAEQVVRAVIWAWRDGGSLEPSFN